MVSSLSQKREFLHATKPTAAAAAAVIRSAGTTTLLYVLNQKLMYLRCVINTHVLYGSTSLYLVPFLCWDALLLLTPRTFICVYYVLWIGWYNLTLENWRTHIFPEDVFMLFLFSFNCSHQNTTCHEIFMNYNQSVAFWFGKMCYCIFFHSINSKFHTITYKFFP